MKRNIFETVLGGIVLVVAAGFLMFFYKTTDIKPSSGYEVSAVFTKIDGLESGSPVRISGVKVGQVLDFSIDPATFRAIVRMNVKKGIQLPADTAAVIVSDGLLGGKFMSLEPGSSEDLLEAGDVIEFTQSTPSLEQLLGQVVFSLQKETEKKK